MRTWLVVFSVGLIALGIWLAGGASVAQARAAQADYKPTQDEVTVQPGDTLWDLSERVTGSPWHWPRVWAYNPEITNPHWIYPGDIVRFHPSELELPTLATLVASQREMPEEPVVAAPETDDTPRIMAVEATKATRRRVERIVSTFVTPKELSEAGTLTNSDRDAMLLAPKDVVYLEFPQGKAAPSGGRFMVYRTLGRVVHPITKQDYGFMTQVTGLVSMDGGVEKSIGKARLDRTWVEIERGQYVTPAPDGLEVSVDAVPASGDVSGVVLAIQYDAGVIAGQDNIVFVDKGKNDGVQRGNRFAVYTKGDAVTGRAEGIPMRSIATLAVLDVKENASTCLVLNSRQEIEAGYTVRAVNK